MQAELILTSLTLGLLSSTSPCVLPLYPGFLAYLGGVQDSLSQRRGRYFLGLFVLAGVLSMMLALGLIIALLSISVGQVLAWVIPVADAMIILLGLLLVFNHNPFKALPQVRIPLLHNPYINAYTYGLLYGPIALPCSGPLVVGIFALSLTVGEAAGKLSTFLWFGLGFGLPLLALSLLSGSAQRWITGQFVRHARLINLVGGLLLISVGLYDLWSNWEQIALFLS